MAPDLETHAELLTRAQALEDALAASGLEYPENAELLLELDQIWARARALRPWTRFVDCCGTSEVYVEGSEDAAVGLFERWLGYPHDGTCSMCGDWSWYADDEIECTPPEQPGETVEVVRAGDVEAFVASSDGYLTGMDHNHAFAMLRPRGACPACDETHADTRKRHGELIEQLDRLVARHHDADEALLLAIADHLRETQTD